MKIIRLVGGELESNGYIIYDKEGGQCYIIDPGYNPENFLMEIDRLNITPKGILLTHHHYDHVGGVEQIQQKAICPVFLHDYDKDMYGKPINQVLQDGQSLWLGDEEIKVIHTPGHTKGSVCFFCEKSGLSFTGDTIFNIDLGRTDLIDGSIEMMIRSMKDIVSKWKDEITIYPGHGDSATMDYVRRNNYEYLDLVNRDENS